MREKSDPGLRDIFESLQAALVVLSADLRPAIVNSAAQLMLGGLRSDHTAVRLAIERSEWLARMVESCLSDGRSIDGEGDLLRIDGRRLRAQADVTPLIDRAGARHGVVIMLRERPPHERLPGVPGGEDQTVAGLSATGLAHEVRNPLAGIKGAAELLGAMFPSDQRVKLYCGIIADGAQKIATLVERVLAVGTRRGLKPEPVNVHRLIDDAVRIAGLLPSPRGDIRVERLFDPSLPPVLGDSDSLLQAFLNILRNSAEAFDAPDGLRPVNKIVRIKTRMEGVFRRVAREPRRNFMRVEITDNGGGVNDDEFGQLFTALFTTKASGTGLGLLLSRRIVAQHGGRLWAERRGLAEDNPPPAGEAARSRSGLTICIVLPIAPEEEGAAAG